MVTWHSCLEKIHLANPLVTPMGNSASIPAAIALVLTRTRSVLHRYTGNTTAIDGFRIFDKSIDTAAVYLLKGKQGDILRLPGVMYLDCHTNLALQVCDLYNHLLHITWSSSRIEPMRALTARAWFIIGHALRFAALHQLLPLGPKYRTIIALVRYLHAALRRWWYVWNTISYAYQGRYRWFRPSSATLSLWPRAALSGLNQRYCPGEHDWFYTYEVGVSYVSNENRSVSRGDGITLLTGSNPEKIGELNRSQSVHTV